MAAPDDAGLLNRDEEREEVNRLLADARAGGTGVLLLRGDPGIGKTTLLRYVAGNASGF